MIGKNIIEILWIHVFKNSYTYDTSLTILSHIKSFKVCTAARSSVDPSLVSSKARLTPERSALGYNSRGPLLLRRTCINADPLNLVLRRTGECAGDARNLRSTERNFWDVRPRRRRSRISEATLLAHRVFNLSTTPSAPTRPGRRVYPVSRK